MSLGSASTHGDRRGAVLRLLLGFTGVTLLGYIPYRYATRPPRFEGVLGSAYALLLPLSLLLAAGAILMALRPVLLGRLRAGAGAGAGMRSHRRVLLGVYGGLWLLMGLLCVSSLDALTRSAPLRGLLATVHMTAQHVFLGVAAMVAAWRPEMAAGLLGVAVTEGDVRVPVRAEGDAAP